MPDSAVLALVTALAARDDREGAAGRLAAYLGGEHLLIFVCDHEVDTYLPAPGFPQTLPDGRRWRAFLERAASEGSTDGTLPFGSKRQETPARAIASKGVVLVLLGGTPIAAALDETVLLMPLVSEALRTEQVAITATARAESALAAAAEASGLALALDGARRESRMLYEELRVALEAREMFFAMASHEMKTPLAAIKGYAQLLVRRLNGPTPDFVRLAEMAETVNEEVDRMIALVGDLLELGAPQGRKQALHREQIDLVALAQKVLSRFEQDPRRPAGIVFSFDGPHLLIGEWDRERLDQVLTNLLSNAVKYSPHGGEVSLVLAEDGPHAVIRLSDQGRGIPKEDQAKVFSAFYRSQGASKIEGSGLGLYIAAQLVEQHGGHISASSEIGRGSVFTIVLPIREEDRAARQPA